MNVEFFFEHGVDTPRHVSREGEVNASLFELDETEAEAALLAWFRGARVRWLAAQRRVETRSGLRLVGPAEVR